MTDDTSAPAASWFTHALLEPLLEVAVATLLFVAAVSAIAWLRRRLTTTSTARDFSIRGFTLLRGTQLRTTVDGVLSVIAWSIGLLVAYGWLTFVLTRFPATREVGELLGATLVAQLRKLGVAAAGGIPGLVAVAFIFWVTHIVRRLVSRFFDAVGSGVVKLSWLHADTAAPTRRIASGVLWIAAIIAAYPYMPGSESEAFKNVGVLVGVMVSLGSSGVIGQAMSGLVVMYARALKPGDFVRIGEVEGTVTELGLMSTKVRTVRDEEVTLPSSVVVSSPTLNYSRLAAQQGVAITLRATIGYDEPWRRVHQLLEQAAAKAGGIRTSPAPYVAQTGLGDFAVLYTLHAWIDDPARQMWILSELQGHVLDAFNEAGIQVLTPHYMANPAEPAIVPKERWFPADVEQQKAG